MWLNTYDLDIRCVRLKPYVLDGRVLIDVQQVIPLPEAAEYQIQVRDKVQKERQARVSGADFTRYDITIGGQVYTGQWKRRALLLIARTLVESGVSVERIAELLDHPLSKVWWSVEGVRDSAAFIERAQQDAERDDRAFDERRWFCQEDELIHRDGRTYAFSNQWTGQQFLAGMKRFAEEHPALNITCSPTSASSIQ